MDKNVGSVNLDELKAAREALDRERGVETDPNMYNDYDPEKHKAEREQEKLARANESESADSDLSGDVSADEIQEVSANDSISEPSLDSLSGNEENLNLSNDEFSADADLDNMEVSSETADEIVSSLLDAFGETEDDESILDEKEESDTEIKLPETDESVSEISNEIESESAKTSETIDEFNDYARSPEKETDEPSKSSNENTNFDIYDNFADFEINSESAEKESSFAQQSQPTPEPEIKEVKEEIEEKTESLPSESNENNLDDFLSELDSILSKDSDDSEISDDIIVNDKIEDVEKNDENEISDDFSSNDMLDKFDLKADSSDEIKNVDVEEKADTSNEDGLKNIESETEESVEELPKIEPEIQEKPAAVGLDRFMVDESSINYTDEELIEKAEDQTEVLTDFSKLSEIAEEIEAENLVSETAPAPSNEESETENAKIYDLESEDDEDLEDDEVKAGEFSKIKKFNFVDVMSTKDFEEADNFSYVLGKNSEDEIVFGNLRDTCGTAIFARNEEVIFEQFSSMLLSLLIKNTPNDIQFVICDAMYDSEFDVFANSSYMYFNRVAKNNREIVDTLLELSKELENRYNNLVYSGVKSIGAYNMQVEERGGNKMPYVVLFLNNYAKMNQFLDSDRINVCLHNILKFGRLVGVYAVIASTSEIDRKDINFNLPTRISYRAEDEHASIAALGREGAENLKDEKDFLYSTIYDEEMKHLKVPSLSKEEIELIIENLEK